MAGEVLKALIFRPKVGESGMMVRRNARFSLGQARGQALCIPTWPLHTNAFILIFASLASFEGGDKRPPHSPHKWCKLQLVLTRSFGLTLVINS